MEFRERTRGEDNQRAGGGKEAERGGGSVGDTDQRRG